VEKPTAFSNLDSEKQILHFVVKILLYIAQKKVVFRNNPCGFYSTKNLTWLK